MIGAGLTLPTLIKRLDRWGRKFARNHIDVLRWSIWFFCEVERWLMASDPQRHMAFGWPGSISEQFCRGLHLVRRGGHLVELFQHAIMQQLQSGAMVNQAAEVTVRIQRLKQHGAGSLESENLSSINSRGRHSFLRRHQTDSRRSKTTYAGQVALTIAAVGFLLALVVGALP
ncbi:hypothetical protein FJ970_17985 [Mesorhizobium sp. B2-1-8]|uniref:hypothetical protein n=1 Tax=Mesorhizobium sp. B2-1-8 TaxID=2589967 RepID=UPI001125D940|nr:hypothetical protein [Mesorhizobium sp. B2-1-8]UCI17023.1 hypothetical protein FJ970_17985 [Mesorhizobium sp. B2-1-8]